MSKRNTLIVAVIVAAVAIVGVFTYAYWDQIATMVGFGTRSQQYDTGWIELRNGIAADGKTYQVAQNPDSAPYTNYGSPAPANPFNPSIASRWDCTGCSEDPGQIWLYLGEDSPAGVFNMELWLNYESTQIPQAEPLLIESINTQGGVVDSVIVRDEVSGACVADNTGWVNVKTDCSSGGGKSLSIELAAGGGLRFSATDGSLNIGGVRVHGVIPAANVSLDIPKTVNPAIIGSTNSMNFTFNIQNNGSDDATHIMMYESFVDNSLDGQIDMANSTIGGVSLASLETCSQPNPAGGYCFLDLGGAPGVPDTIIAYFPTLSAGSNIPVELTLVPKITLGGGNDPIGFTAGAYTNAVGITAAEMNVGNPTYPPSTIEDLVEGLNNDGINDWIWVNRTATVNVGGITPPGEPGLVIDKVPASQMVMPGSSPEFTIRVGNESSVPATKVFLFDSWVDNNFDRQVESVDFKLANEADWVPLGTPSGNLYEDCGGTVELGACYLDTDNDGFGDTILIYTEGDNGQGIGQFPLTDFFSLRFNLKSKMPNGVYKNKIGITSKELNPNDSGYPGNFGVEQWNWILDEAVLNVGGIEPPPPPPPPPPPGDYSAVISKTVTNLSNPGSDTYNIGDNVEYTLELMNNGSETLTNMKVRDDYDENLLDDVQIVPGYGTACSEIVQPGANKFLCFDVGTMTASESGQIIAPLLLKYTARIKNNAAGATVTNEAICQSDQFPDTSDPVSLETCEVSVDFTVAGITPPPPPPPPGDFDLYVNESVDKKAAGLSDRLNYVTTGGNQGEAAADRVLFVTSLLIPGPQVVHQIAEAFPANVSIENLEKVLQQKLGIISHTEINDIHRSVLGPSGVSNYGELLPYTNLPGDDYVTGLDFSGLIPPGEQYKLDLDRDGIIDTIVHVTEGNWTAGYERNENLHTYVRSSLAPGRYAVNNTGIIIKDFAEPDYLGQRIVLMDQVTTTVNVTGEVEPDPEIAIVKTVTDNDETNVTNNTASPGEVMTYTITYTNLENPSRPGQGGIAREAWIEDNYDAAFVDIIDAGDAEDSGSALMWSLGEVGYGESVTKTYKARIVPKVPGAGISFSNIATAGAKSVEPVSASVQTNVPGVGPLEPFVVAHKDLVNVSNSAIQAGDILEHKIVVQNIGEVAAVDVEIQDKLSPHVQNLEVLSISNQVMNESTQNELLLSAPRLESNQKIEAVYRVQVKENVPERTKVINELLVEAKDETTPASPGISGVAQAVGRVGSAFTGPGTAAAEAARIAGAQTVAQAPETGGNPLVIAIVTAALAVGAGIGVMYLRKQLLVSQ